MRKVIFVSLLALLLAGTASAQTPRFRIAAQGGFGYRLGSAQETGQEVIDRHDRKLKTGINYGADVTWYFDDFFGIGLKFNDMNSRAEDAVTISYNDGSPSRSGIYRDVVDLRFIGPMCSSRSVSSSGRWIWMVNYGLGYLSYTDNGRLIDPMSLNGWTLGGCMETGVDFRLMNNLWLGASLDMIGGKLSSYKITKDGKTEEVKLDKDEREGLYHLTASIGLRLYL